jgi:hypothetical protein
VGADVRAQGARRRGACPRAQRARGTGRARVHAARGCARHRARARIGGRERGIARRPPLEGEELYVAAIAVDEGPTLKRWRARARGRVARIKKRTCHITVTLAQAEIVEAPAKPKRAAATPTTEQPKAAPKESPLSSR